MRTQQWSLPLVDKETHDLQEQISKTVTVAVGHQGIIMGERKAGSAGVLAGILAVTGRRE